MGATIKGILTQDKIKSAAVAAAFEKLPLPDQNKVMAIGQEVRAGLKAIQQKISFGDKGIVELLGKLGMWMIDKDNKI